MRSLPFASRLRRLRLLALAPLVLATACIAGEPIPPGNVGSITGRYVLNMFSEGLETIQLPMYVDDTEDGLPIFLRYATLDIYSDSTYVEIYQLDVMDETGTEVVDTRYESGQGKWSLVGLDVKFTSTYTPSLLPDATSWSGYQGSGDYAFSIERYTMPERLMMHYRRY